MFKPRKGNVVNHKGVSQIVVSKPRKRELTIKMCPKKEVVMVLKPKRFEKRIHRASYRLASELT